MSESAWNDQRMAFWTRVIWIVSVAVWLLVGAMRRLPEIPLPPTIDLSGLPMLHATLNSVAAVCLVLALVSIKRGAVGWHRRWINIAMGCSAVFLVSYVVYNLTQGDTHYGGEGWMRSVYFVVLITHIILAALVLPFVLKAWLLGQANRRTQHRRLVKWVFPIWLYVAISGPVCYLMLRPYY